MDETQDNQPPFLHKPHSHHRYRRIRLVSISSALLTLLALALTSTPPAATHTGEKPSSTTGVTTQEDQNQDSLAQQATDSAGKALDQAKGAVLGAQPGLWHVTRGVDGDTIDVQLGTQKETVRLLGIDTPETHDPRKPVQCFGEAAAAHTKQALEGKNVRLEPDPQDSDRDKYNRLLRYVYLPDGTLYNAELVRDGYAFAYTVFPISKLDEFRALETEARNANRGLWAGCNVNESQQIKQTAGTK